MYVCHGTNLIGRFESSEKGFVTNVIALTELMSWKGALALSPLFCAPPSQPKFHYDMKMIRESHDELLRECEKGHLILGACVFCVNDFSTHVRSHAPSLFSVFATKILL